ncbi:uncharacterized protein LOC106636235 [Copidosoma floridanum]|uniref:uncharacterized protein LOC106636235 n=1 Tax=Copidosoma floridanum TaxID=29053 RepID=UPI0006C9643B|nr:uncharacterized protein LOC106636235 [Copidosoma floridanum]
MHHEQSKGTPLQRIESNRLKNTKISDSSESRQLDCSTLSVGSPRRKLHPTRASSMSLNLPNASLRKLEAENYNLDMELAYSDYVASHLELILEKEALRNAEKCFTTSIKNLCEETKALHEKYKLIETRIKEVKAAGHLTDYQDKIAFVVKNVKADLNDCEIITILPQLKNLLNRFNILRCENTILPANKEEVEEFKKVVTECFETLENISDLAECEALENFSENFKAFTTTSQEINSLKKIIEDEIFTVQSETLKTCSHIFAL